MRLRTTKNGYVFIIDKPYYKSPYYKTKEARDLAAAKYLEDERLQQALYEKARKELYEKLS